MFQAKTPLHEVWCVKFSAGQSRNSDWRKTGCRVRLRRRTGKLALLKSRTKRLIGGHGGVNRTVRYSRSDRCSADSPKEPTLKSFHVRWVDTNYVGDAAGQDIAEESEAGTQHGFGFKLPGDGRSG